MIESGTGRTERAQAGKRRSEAWRPLEAQHGDVRTPRPLLPLVDSEPLQTLVQVARQGRRPALLVVEDQHADAARLAVAMGREDDLRSRGGRLPQGTRDRVDLFRRSMAEEGERDVQMVAAECPSLGGQILALPADERFDCLVRQSERTEEPEPFTALDASSE